MTKIKDFPHCDLTDALSFAEIVDTAGGQASLDLVADRLKMSAKGGAFHWKVSGTSKYGLVRREGDVVKVTPLTHKILHPMSPEEKLQGLREAVKHVPLFNDVLMRFAGKPAPRDLLENVFIREFGIEPSLAGRIAGYFVKAADIAKLFEKQGGETVIVLTDQPIAAKTPLFSSSGLHEGEYAISIHGPDLNLDFKVTDSKDLDDVDALLKVVRRKISKE